MYSDIQWLHDTITVVNQQKHELCIYRLLMMMLLTSTDTNLEVHFHMVVPSVISAPFIVLL